MTVVYDHADERPAPHASVSPIPGSGGAALRGAPAVNAEPAT